MSKRSIFLVIGSEYEGSAVFGAFEAKRDAEALVAACLSYVAAPRPALPSSFDDTPENDAAWERFGKRDERWRKRHPAGYGGDNYDCWTVQRIRLQEPGARSDQRVPDVPRILLEPKQNAD